MNCPDNYRQLNGKENMSRKSRSLLFFSRSPAIKPKFAKLPTAFLLIAICLSFIFAHPTQADLGGDLFLVDPAQSDTFSVAWGDWDDDGDLDLAVGNGQFNQVYENEAGSLQLDPANGLGWQSTETKRTRSLAWGDWDGDGDLDLAVGNLLQSNQVYENEGGTLQLDQANGLGWQSTETSLTNSIAWGDWDGDGDLDLAVGNQGESNQVYENDGGDLRLDPANGWGWQSTETDDTFSVAWGDWDGDGDLDLAAGNRLQPNRVYENEGGTLLLSPIDELGWQSIETDYTISVAWGDWDGDGDLDLAVGNRDQPNQVYENEAGTLQLAPTIGLGWQSKETDGTISVAWGDWDGDGDLDLAAGNIKQANQVYENEGGTLQLDPIKGLGWESVETNRTHSVAWGDWGNDGDLDLAVGNVGVNQVYENDGGKLQFDPAKGQGWQSAETDDTKSVAWGDWDGDGDLDLAVGNRNQANQVYENEAGTLRLDPANTWGWQSNEINDTYSVAWGDWDDDGDLDLAVGNILEPNQVYENDEGSLRLDPANNLGWQSAETGDTKSVAWGDWDGDGDLDLAVGNFGEANQVYENEAGTLQLDPDNGLGWQSNETNQTFSVAWGDWDGDGDLDLAVGNENERNQVYENEAGTLQLDPDNGLGWQSNETNNTKSVAWGDWDGDGDLDLAVGNFGQVNQVYENQGGKLQLLPAAALGWRSTETRNTRSVAWGDWNGDGDLDLAVGNAGKDKDREDGEVNQIYENEGGTLQLDPANGMGWQSTEINSTNSVAWGDWNGDGDLDLAAGNFGQANQVYQNGRWPGERLDDTPPFLAINHPGPTAPANFFTSPETLPGPIIPISYTLFGTEANPVRTIRVFYSPNGGGQWLPATAAPGTDLTNLAASPWPTGTTYTFPWQADADLIKNDNVAIRIEAYEGFKALGSYQRAYASAQTFPFRVEAAEWFAQVIDQDNRPVAGAMVYYNGQPITTEDDIPATTDPAGLLKLDEPIPGQPLVALAQTFEQPTIRDVHDGWAYRVYLTSLGLDGDGTIQYDVIKDPGRQLLTVHRENPLILFNIVVSVEWDAEKAYLDDLAEAFQHASDYLYDVTDGQMAFGQVQIYDTAQYWSEADFQFSTKNDARPQAYRGGITAEDKAETIIVGRFWDGETSHSGNWKLSAGFRTLIHEFGHYGLYLEDENYGRIFDDEENYLGDLLTACTDGEDIGPPATPERDKPDNASIMYYQYNSSELADDDRWTTACSETEQQRVNQKSDWQTVKEKYSGAEWTITTPISRGQVIAGPTQFPNNLLPFPKIITNNLGLDQASSVQVTVNKPNGEPQHNARVALYTTSQPEAAYIGQGLTVKGEITVYGAAPGDTIQAGTLDGALSGKVTINDTNKPYILTLESQAAFSPQAADLPPYLILTPGQTGQQNDLDLWVFDLAPTDGPFTAIVTPVGGQALPPKELEYSDSDQIHLISFSLPGNQLGTGRIQINDPNGVPILSSDYSLQPAEATAVNTIYSADGNFTLHTPADSLGFGANGLVTVATSGNVPNVPEGVQLVGNAYDLGLSEIGPLAKQSSIKLYYHPAVMGHYEELAIYYWLAPEKQWQAIGGTLNPIDFGVTIADNRQGIYALMGKPTTQPPSLDKLIFLPTLLKNSYRLLSSRH